MYFSICQLSSVVPLCDAGHAGHTSTPLYILLTTRDGSATYASESMNVCLCLYLGQCCNIRLLGYDQVNSDTRHTCVVCVCVRACVSVHLSSSLNVICVCYSQLYRSASFNSSGRSSTCDTADDMYSDISLEEDMIDLNHKVS